LRPTVLISNQTKPLALASRLSCPLVGYMRGWYRPDTLVPYERYLLRHRVDHLIAVSNATRAALASGGVPWERISVIPNPADIAALEREAIRPLPAPLPQTQSKIRLLLAANILRDKGQHTAVAALGDLVHAGYDAVLYLAGDVPFAGSSAYRQELCDLAARLGVSKRLVWLGVRSDLPALIRACSAVILPTKSEGMARVLLEAMALDRPVMTTPVGGNTDLIIDKVTGLLFDPDDHKGLAEAVRWIEGNPAQTQTMVQMARRCIILDHSTTQHTERLLKLANRMSAARTESPSA
jgi:glycosyltransferase involved in cell wall biosynthesis